VARTAEQIPLESRSISIPDFTTEHLGYCVNRSRSVPCHLADGQMGKIIKSILLPKSYLDQVLEEIQLADDGLGR